ncbi:TagK domain-containing protein [Burkholderia sp. Ac-20345]|uniref:TagK domain-containing protein n=1 Tax=Burkholderia sp. Ac-20345 TaxID=2703891 RepID=UPI00197B55AD|nr:TagK domain-containing protein [Burkholderia sp. Ac-20345]MBN3775997.1 TagK domain-containing protein [Burkholderia sp. Ac-20345]
MRSFRMPWHRRPDTSLTEPELRNEPPDSEKREDSADFLLFEPSDRVGSNTSILNLIGSHGVTADTARGKRGTGSQAMPLPERTDDLVETLHAQYWRALTDPHTALSGSWGEQLDSHATPVASVMPDSHDLWPTPTNAAASGSIEVMLSGKRNLEDAFGHLNTGFTPELEIEPVPEVLRLFAPPEFHAAEARRAPALPPALTRREHHALSVDSPLAAPVRKDDA